MTDHVLLIHPWASEYLCDTDKPDKTPTGTSRVVTPFEIVRERTRRNNSFSRGGAITVSFDFETRETELGSEIYTEDDMCAACFAMLVVAKVNKIEFNTPNLKSRIKRLLREPK
jgi:hypothetical protein